MTAPPVAAAPVDEDFTRRVRVATNVYVLQSLDDPAGACVFHAVKLVLPVTGWMWWVRFAAGLGTLSGFTALARRKPWGCGAA